MASGVHPSDSGSGSHKKVDTSTPLTGKVHYSHSAMAQIKKFWQALFPDYELTDLQAQKMNDAFFKFVGDQMNGLMNWALAQQKKRDQEEKQERGG